MQTKSTDVEDVLEIAEFKSLDNPKIVTSGKGSEENNSKLTLLNVTAQTTNDVNLVVEDTTATATITITVIPTKKSIEATTTKLEENSKENQIELVMKTTERPKALCIKNATRMGTTTTMEPVKSVQGTSATAVEEPNLPSTSTFPKSPSENSDSENLNIEAATITTTEISTGKNVEGSTTIAVEESTEMILKTIVTNSSISPKSTTKSSDSYASDLATETTTTAIPTVESSQGSTAAAVDKPNYAELTRIISLSSTPMNTNPYNLYLEDTTVGITTTTKLSTVVTESKEIIEVIEPPLRPLPNESSSQSPITQFIQSKGSKATETVATTIPSTIYFTKEPKNVDEKIEMVSQTSDFKGIFSTDTVESSKLNNIFQTTNLPESSQNYYSLHEKNLNTNSNNKERGKGKYFCKVSIIPRTCRFVKKVIGGTAKKVFGIIGKRR